MNPLQGGPQSAVPKAVQAIYLKLVWLWQHKLITGVLATIGAVLVSPVVSQLVLDSDVYDRVKRTRPIDKIWGFVEWLWSGTTPVPVWVLAILITGTLFALAFWFVHRFRHLCCLRFTTVKSVKSSEVSMEQARISELDPQSGGLQRSMDSGKGFARLTEPIRIENQRLKTQVGDLQRRIDELHPPDLQPIDKEILRVVVTEDVGLLRTNSVHERFNVTRQRFNYHVGRLEQRHLVVLWSPHTGTILGDDDVAPEWYWIVTNEGRELSVSLGFI